MNLIALCDENFAIGLNGEQIVYIPDDLRHFKELTLGKTIVLGRKTLSTFPGKKPLKGRNNIVLSRDKNFKTEGATVVNSIEEALKIMPEDSFIIGGESIYKAFFSFCDKAYITALRGKFEADKYFPSLKDDENWCLFEESEEKTYKNLKYTYRIYKRVKGR